MKRYFSSARVTKLGTLKTPRKHLIGFLIPGQMEILTFRGYKKKTTLGTAYNRGNYLKE